MKSYRIISQNASTVLFVILFAFFLDAHGAVGKSHSSNLNDLPAFGSSVSDTIPDDVASVGGLRNSDFHFI